MRVNKPGKNGIVEKMEEWERIELLSSLTPFPPAIIALNNSVIIAPNKQNQGIKEVEEVGMRQKGGKQTKVIKHGFSPHN